MGSELGSWNEWNHDGSLDWHLAEHPMGQRLCRFMTQLGQLYRRCSPMWREDHHPSGFNWINADDRDNSVLAYVRRDGERHVVVVLNLTPSPREGYRIGAPSAGTFVQLLSSDDEAFGGSGYPTHERIGTEEVPFHGFAQSLTLTLPPLGVIVLAPEWQAGDWR
jgi:1,4-alpha-glucan branching enzyme